MRRRGPLPVGMLAVALPVAALFALSPSFATAQASGGIQPFVGVWKLNFEASHLRVSPGFAVYRQFKNDGGGWMSHTLITITPAGTSFLFTAARYDGKPYADYTPASLGNLVRQGTKPPRTVTFNRVDAHQIRWADRVNGQVVARGTETISPNGNTLTITNQPPGQKTITTQVFDRVSGPGR